MSFFFLLLMFTCLFQITHFMPLPRCPFQPTLLCWVLHTGLISPLFSRPFCLCLCVLKAAQSSCTLTPQMTIWSFWEPLNQVGCSICTRWWLSEKYEDLLGTRVHSDWPIGNKQTNDRKKNILSMSHFCFVQSQSFNWKQLPWEPVNHQLSIHPSDIAACPSGEANRSCHTVRGVLCCRW